MSLIDRRERGRSLDERDRSVESTSAEGNALSDVGKEEITFNFTFQCHLCGEGASGELWDPRANAEGDAELNRWLLAVQTDHASLQTGSLTEHATRDIHSYPFMPLLCQDLARESGSSSNIEQVCRSRDVLVLF